MDSVQWSDSLIEEGLAVSASIGMRLLNERLTVFAGVVGAPKKTNPGGLSDREVEVLTLVAAGKSNPEVAEALFLSTNTVYRHVANIFAKINVSNRVEAATYAKDKGIA